MNDVQVTERLAGGLPVLEVTTGTMRATLSLQGGQLLSFTPAGDRDWLWLSRRALFEPGKAIRGGIPLCWPWFGPAPDAALPAHGFARTHRWTLEDITHAGNGAELRLALADDASTRRLWPHPFRLQLRLLLGHDLQLELEATNTGTAPVQLGHALHSYFRVDDIAGVRITGLDGCHYLDQLQQHARLPQRGDVTIDREVDRIYEGGSHCLLHDGARQLAIDATGCGSTIVWNPWQDKAARLADMGDDEYRGFVCIENGNTGRATVTLAPGARHASALRVSRRA